MVRVVVCLYRKRKRRRLFLFICFSESVQSSAEWTNHILGLTANEETLRVGLGLGVLTLVCPLVLLMIFYSGCLPDLSHSLKTLGRFGLGWVNICSSAAVIVEFLLRGQPGSTGADCRSWDCCNSPSWIGSPVGHRRGRLDIIRWLH